MSRRTRTLLAIAGAASLALPATASANDFQTVYREYKRTGTVKPCRFSDNTLRNAQRQTPPDVEQYAPSFLDALENARERSGDCHKKAAPAPTPTQAAPTPSTPAPVPSPTQAAPVPAPTQTAPVTTPAPTPPAETHIAGVPSPPVNATKRDSEAPAPVWLLAVLGALALAAALVAALAWWFGWSTERFSRPFSASWADFADRARAFRLELGDWIRTGH